MLATKASAFFVFEQLQFAEIICESVLYSFFVLRLFLVVAIININSDEQRSEAPERNRSFIGIKEIVQHAVEIVCEQSDYTRQTNGV